MNLIRLQSKVLANSDVAVRNGRLITFQIESNSQFDSGVTELANLLAIWVAWQHEKQNYKRSNPGDAGF